MLHGGLLDTLRLFSKLSRLRNDMLQIVLTTLIDKGVRADVALDKRHSKLAMSMLDAICNSLGEHFEVASRMPSG